MPRTGRRFLGYPLLSKAALTGTVTDINGKYLLPVPKGYNELIFSFVGMLTREVKIDGKAIIDVSLDEDVIGLEEVVVTALGITRERKPLDTPFRTSREATFKQMAPAT